MYAPDSRGVQGSAQWRILHFRWKLLQEITQSKPRLCEVLDSFLLRNVLSDPESAQLPPGGSAIHHVQFRLNILKHLKAMLLMLQGNQTFLM